MRAWTKRRSFSATDWPTTPPSGRSPSSTAANTTASLWSTISRTTWCRPTRGDNALEVFQLSAGHLLFNQSEESQMKQIRILLSAVLIFAVIALGQGQATNSAATPSAPQAQQSQPAPTIASTVDREISGVEKQILE